MDTQPLIDRALDDLFHDMPGGTLTRHRVEHVLQGLTHHVATQAGHEALRSLLTTDDMAERLHLSVRRVQKIAKDRQVGWEVARGIRVFVPDDIERLRPGPVGRPRAARPE